MKNLQMKISHNRKIVIISMVFSTVIIAAALAFGHGGKHADTFTHLQALQKATRLYDQLIAKGKLDQSWETGLEYVFISNRKQEGKNEVMVEFQRQKGDPKAVYMFFNSTCFLSLWGP